MSSSWLSNKGAENRVKDLIKGSGFLLENKATNICNQFSVDNSIKDKIFIWVDKPIYTFSVSDNSNGIYREIDVQTQIYEEIPISDSTLVQLSIKVPIECKYRENIEYFGHPPVLDSSRISQGFPIYGDLKGSLYFASLSNSFESIKPLCIATNITSVEIKDGKTPRKLEDNVKVNKNNENVIYNAGGSLYDYILTDLTAASKSSSVTYQEEALLNELGVSQEFLRYIIEKRYLWWSVFDDWIKQIDIDKVRKFNEKYFKGERIGFQIEAYLPFICVNGPLYNIACNSNFDIEHFQETNNIVTSIRKHSWPGLARIGLLFAFPEVSIGLTNLDGIPKMLNIAFKWYQEIRTLLITAPPEIVERWAIESAMYRAILSHNIRKEGSDK